MGVVRTLSAKYRVEPDMKIGWASPNWDRFARENGAAELTRDAVVGRPLLDFIEGSEIRALYDALFSRVRDSGIEIALDFRCDSPETRRFMKLHITCPEDDRVMVSAELLREESRARASLLDGDRPRAGEPVGICSFCKQVEARGGRWCEVEEAEAELGITEDVVLPPLAHTVCPACRAAAEPD